MVEATLLQLLAADFPKGEVRSRDGGAGKKLDYIDIVQTIRRLDDVLGADWDWNPTAHTLTPVPDYFDRNGNPMYLATVRGNIVITLRDPTSQASIQRIERGGVGSDVANDPDKALKTADAEALKKAGHKYLIGLYLWDESARQGIAEFRKLAKLPKAQLKQAVVTRVGSQDPAVIAAALGVEVADLGYTEVLADYLASSA